MRRHGMETLSISLRFERGHINFHHKGSAMRLGVALVVSWKRRWTNSPVVDDLRHDSLMGRHHNVGSYSNLTMRDKYNKLFLIDWTVYIKWLTQ